MQCTRGFLPPHWSLRSPHHDAANTQPLLNGILTSVQQVGETQTFSPSHHHHSAKSHQDSLSPQSLPTCSVYEHTPPYLLPWGFSLTCSTHEHTPPISCHGDFFLGMQLSYTLGFFFYQGLFYCPLSTISFYYSLVPLAVPYLVAPEFSGPVAPLLSLVAYAARAS